ncbi:Elongator subunit elp2 [Chamberlinius hualienensis]
MCDTCYTSVGCNLIPHTLDWGINNLICFGACNSVAIYDPMFPDDAGSIRQTRTGHLGRVNCVRWIKIHGDVSDEMELISTSSDKTAVLWEFKDSLLTPKCKLEGHESIVTVADGMITRIDERKNTLLATASSDNTLKIWTYTDEGVKCCQTIKLKSDFALDVKIWCHPVNLVPMLLYGGSDTKLHILAMSNNEFTPVLTLVGHEDWIRAIAIIPENNENLLIASSAQDCLIKLWRLSWGSKDIEKDDINLKVNTYNIITLNGEIDVYDVCLEANLMGHDNWIYGLHWDRSLNSGDSPRLLSASMDKTMIVWELDHNLGIWIEKVRVGEVGGNTLGFYGCRFSPNGNMILAHGFQGALHLWNFNKDLDTWKPRCTVGGHFKAVVDLDWDPLGEFIVSASLDQTTRLHFPWSKDRSQSSWHEMARPQVHGYDMASIAMINRHTFASGADEKLVRVFETPKNFLNNFTNLTGKEFLPHDVINNALPEGASIPSLGLSNRAIYDKSSKCDMDAKHPKDVYQDAYFVSTSFSCPPTEETLLQNTLWPEVHKLYGHGNEIYSVAASRDGTLLATASKAAKAEHAYIILWDTQTWKEITRLCGPSLTVVQMEFSPCNTMLLSVSRDRTWHIFKLNRTEQGLDAIKVAYTDKKTCVHTRIIWTCAWCPDGSRFATGARDNKVIVWKIDQPENTNEPISWNVEHNIDFEDAVTAVAFSPITLSGNRFIMAVGLESGTIYLKIVDSNKQCLTISTLSYLYYHHLAIRRLRFRPVPGIVGTEDKDSNKIQLASCGEDNAIRIFNITCSL